uniref:Uncharacterized protein n=1 Tax=Chlamydomonas euryale TaxID=1486919 RepID=A0A7R9VZK7_9CHLO|mmetsp:Transcript_7313/g.22261  ORF Transcript_7313/g.22261 Transcript_7313/m.22261 type:complete len:326 (+) Transcript_7313:117-1094(+)
MQQRKVALEAGRAEEGRAPYPGVEIAGPSKGQPPPGYAHDEEWRKRQVPSPRQGWSPTVVLLVAAILISCCYGWYMSEQYRVAQRTMSQLSLAYQSKEGENTQALAMRKRHVEQLEKEVSKLKQTESELQKELAISHEQLTDARHELHEEQTKARRMKRDNDELHKKLQVKAAELKVLEERTALFNQQMSQVTQTLHAIQGEAEEAGETADGDYSHLYGEQEQQQERMHEHFARGGAAGVGARPKPGLNPRKKGGHLGVKAGGSGQLRGGGRASEGGKGAGGVKGAGSVKGAGGGDGASGGDDRDAGEADEMETDYVNLHAHTAY